MNTTACFPITFNSVFSACLSFQYVYKKKGTANRTLFFKVGDNVTFHKIWQNIHRQLSRKTKFSNLYINALIYLNPARHTFNCFRILLSRGVNTYSYHTMSMSGGSRRRSTSKSASGFIFFLLFSFIVKSAI